MGNENSAIQQIAESHSLADHTSGASVLFGNMRVPAAFMAGLLLSLTFAIQMSGSEQVRKANTLLGVLSLLAELLAVVHSTVAVNKLIETRPLPSASVLALIQRDFERDWLGTNVHFLLGLLGAALMIGLRSYVALGPHWGVVTAAATISAVLLILSIVNDGISSGDGMADGVRFGADFTSVMVRYVRLLVAHARETGGPLIGSSLAFGLCALGGGVIRTLGIGAPETATHLQSAGSS
jgi:hypothetical protein